MTQSIDTAYLHPYYNDRGWNNPLNQPVVCHRNVKTVRRLGFPDLPPPPASPGLQEVLSSYTTGPTVILIEKKRPRLMQSKIVRVVCIILALLSLAFLLWSKLWCSNKYKTVSDAEVESLLEGHCGRVNCTSYPSLKHFNYANVVFSVDDDDESHVEDIQPYAVMSS